MDLIELGIDGVTAPPRSNGELVFDAPWEGRSFGMVLSLAEQGMFTLDGFREHLITSIDRWGKANDRGVSSGSDSDSFPYYELWHEALESILASTNCVTDSDLRARAVQLSQRPDGHDHRH